MSRIVNEKGEPFVDDAIEGIEAEPKCDDKPITITWEIRRGQIKHQLYNACLHHFLPMQMLKELFDALNEVVPVVRCKDCKYRIVNEHYGEKGYMKLKAICDLDTGDPFELGRCAENDEWYCADGERKDKVEE